MVAAVHLENFLVIVYFLGTTFFTQITILNMLIAIMSQTYNRHAKGLSELGKRQKLKLMAEYLVIVNVYQKYLCSCCRKFKKRYKTINTALSNNLKSTSYVFLMTPTMDVSEYE